MASKTTPSKSAKSDGGTASALRAEAERLIAKEKYKDAVKQAKLCYKEAATPENHRLLERAYFLRARQLRQEGMRSSAVEVAQHLIDFGITGSDSPEELVTLLAGLGLEKAALSVQERLGTPELKERVTRTVADQLVIHPAKSGDAAPDLLREAGQVRRALELLQGGDEAGTQAILRDLPRSSPLSEWKFFVRGLAAFERGDDEEARANWDRLEPGRAPAAIAVRLRRIADEAAAGSAGGLEAAETLAFGEPILDRLRRLGSLIANHEWDKALPLLGSVRASLRRIDPKLPERLTRVLVGSIIKAVQEMDWYEARSLLDRFCRTAEPLAIDPRWNRLQGLIWDGPQAEPRGAIHYWAEYVGDLADVPAFTPAERALAQAMVWNHIADLHREEVDLLLDEEEGGPPGLSKILGEPPRKRRRESAQVVAARKAVLDAIEKSLRLAPDHLDTYRLLIATHADWKDDKGLEAAAARLLAKAPEDVQTLELLARHHYDRKNHRAALPHILEARRLKPLDDELRTLEWLAHIGMARVYALERKWDEGRAEFVAAEVIEPSGRRDYSYLVRKAMLEYKAGQEEAGDRYAREAGEMLVEPAPLYMALMIESIRFEMPRARTDEYTRLWEAALKKRKRSETVGAMAGLMGALVHADVEYPGRERHIAKLVAYLKKATGLKYGRDDMERIVGFLAGEMPGAHDLFKKMVKAGVKQHPDSVLLQMSAGNLEMMDTGLSSLFGGRIPAGARRHLEAALKLAEASTNPEDTKLLPIIRERLSLLDEAEQAMGRLGGGFGLPFGPGGLPDIFLDDFDEEDFDDDDEGFDEGGPFTPAPRPPSRRDCGPVFGRGRGRKKK